MGPIVYRSTHEPTNESASRASAQTSSVSLESLFSATESALYPHSPPNPTVFPTGSAPPRSRSFRSTRPNTNAVVLLEDTTYTVAPDGSAVEHYRRVVKILRPQGSEEGIIAVPFDKDTKILSMHVWSIGPDGHEYAVKDNEMVEYGYPGPGQTLR